jgi:hypothetical protein
VAELVAKAEPRPDFSIALPLEIPVDANLPALVDCVADNQKAGANIISLTVRARSAEHYIEQLGLIANKVMPRFS